MSMGAGSPKFRIWVTMSAGQEIKRDAGEFARQRIAQIADVISGGMMLFFQGHHDVCVCRRQSALSVLCM